MEGTGLEVSASTSSTLHRQARARAPRSGDTAPAPAWMRLAPEEVALELLGYMLQSEGHSVIQQTLYAGCTVT